MKYENTPYKKRKLYQKSSQNEKDLEFKENTEESKKFSDNIFDAIQTLHDSDYEQKTATGITGMFDSSTTFDNDDYDWNTYEEEIFSF